MNDLRDGLPVRNQDAGGTHASALADASGERFVVAEWDVGEVTVQRLVAAGARWAVRRCGPGDEFLWPESMTEQERRDLEEDAIVPWTATPSSAGTRKLRRRAWQASVWRTETGTELLVFEES